MELRVLKESFETIPDEPGFIKQYLHELIDSIDSMHEPEVSASFTVGNSVFHVEQLEGYSRLIHKADGTHEVIDNLTESDWVAGVMEELKNG